MRTYYNPEKLDAWIVGNLPDWIRPGNPLGICNDGDGKGPWIESDTWPAEANGGAPPSADEVQNWQNSVTDVDIAKQYQQAYQAAEGIIFLLMGRVAPTLIQKKYSTDDTVNAEGAKFTKYHREVIQDFKNAGRHPDAGDEMYDAFVNSKDTFPWVEDETILTIFATTIPRNPT